MWKPKKRPNPKSNKNLWSNALKVQLYNFLFTADPKLLLTDKETDASWDIFIIWKINSGLWGWLDCAKKGLSRLWATFEAHFLKSTWTKNFPENIVGFALISCIEIQKKLWKYFLKGENQFFRAKNMSVSTKTLWSVLCLLLLCCFCQLSSFPFKKWENRLLACFIDTARIFHGNDMQIFTQKKSAKKIRMTISKQICFEFF